MGQLRSCLRTAGSRQKGGRARTSLDARALQAQEAEAGRKASGLASSRADPAPEGPSTATDGTAQLAHAGDSKGRALRSATLLPARPRVASDFRGNRLAG